MRVEREVAGAGTLWRRLAIRYTPVDGDEPTTARLFGWRVDAALPLFDAFESRFWFWKAVQLAERVAQSGPTFSLESSGGLIEGMFCGPTYLIV